MVVDKGSLPKGVEEVYSEADTGTKVDDPNEAAVVDGLYCAGTGND